MFELPLAEAGARARGDPRVREPPARRGRVGGARQAEAPRVLVVDDEPQILRALRVVLREAGFEAVRRRDRPEALDLAAVRPPDAAIVDLVLPDGDGVEVTRTLREWSEMPILVLSAVGEEEQKVRALEAGRTTTSPSRSARASWWRACRRRCAGPGRAEEEPRIEVEGLEIDLAARRRASRLASRSTSPRSSSSCCACWCATAGG